MKYCLQTASALKFTTTQLSVLYPATDDEILKATGIRKKDKLSQTEKEN